MRVFSGITAQAFAGQPSAQPIKLAGISGYAVPLLFTWAGYGASSLNQNIAVKVDLNQKLCTKLDQIRSIYIDNLGSDNPVYVNFPDTNYTAVAKPNSEGWYPAYTNALQFTVIGEGFLTNAIPQTFVIASNIFISPSVNNEIDVAVVSYKASSQITHGATIYNQNFGAPALGDQLFEVPNLSIGAVATIISNLWNTPLASGFLYLTALDIQLSGVNSAGANGAVQLQLTSTGVAGVFDDYFFQSGLAAGASIADLIPLRRFSGGMNFKLDATQQWQLKVLTTTLAGKCSFASAFTTNPQ